jgi:hypothetical protein
LPAFAAITEGWSLIRHRAVPRGRKYDLEAIRRSLRIDARTAMLFCLPLITCG